MWFCLAIVSMCGQLGGSATLLQSLRGSNGKNWLVYSNLKLFKNVHVATP